MGDPLPGTAPRCDPRGWGAFVSGRGCRRPHCAAPSLLPSLPLSFLPSPLPELLHCVHPPPAALLPQGPGLGGARLLAPAPRPPSVGPPCCGLAPFPRGWPGPAGTFWGLIPAFCSVRRAGAAGEGDLMAWHPPAPLGWEQEPRWGKSPAPRGAVGVPLWQSLSSWAQLCSPAPRRYPWAGCGAAPAP